MGSCLCKQKMHRRAGSVESGLEGTSAHGAASTRRHSITEDSKAVQDIIFEILVYMNEFRENENEQPAPLSHILQIADSEEGWCLVMRTMITTIPMNDPLGAVVINLISELCPLPSRDTVLAFTLNLQLSRDACFEAYANEENERYARNLLVVLGCIASKFAGNNCSQMLTQDMLDYLITFLVDERSPRLILHAILVLEKFTVTRADKTAIERALDSQFLNPLLPLELHVNSTDYEWRQVGFAARWSLDNVYLFPGRPMSYMAVDMTETNVILNTGDMTSNLKIGPDGLEARSDSQDFESVRATFQINNGVWYYEAEIITTGVMQIGWATLDTSFESHDGYGVGDDPFSVGYDGCRLLVWHNAHVQRVDNEWSRWCAGDIIGCLIDVPRCEAIFSINGQRLPHCTNIFRDSRLNGIQIYSDACSEGFYPAATFMAHQQCRFNFGTRMFQYPPQDRPFQVINNFGTLSDERKKIIPRHIELASMRACQTSTVLRPCIVCMDGEAKFAVHPCHHQFCLECVVQLADCPLCREPVRFYYPFA